MLKAFEHFIHYEWGFETNVTNDLMVNLSRQEREEFFMDMSHVSWRLWMYSYIHGLKRYTLRGEKDDYVQSPSMYNHLLQPREVSEHPDIDVIDTAMYT